MKPILNVICVETDEDNVLSLLRMYKLQVSNERFFFNNKTDHETGRAFSVYDINKNCFGQIASNEVRHFFKILSIER